MASKKKKTEVPVPEKKRLRTKVRVMSLADVSTRGCPITVDGVDLLAKSSREAVSALTEAGVVEDGWVVLPAGTVLARAPEDSPVSDAEVSVDGKSLVLTLTPDVLSLFM